VEYGIDAVLDPDSKRIESQKRLIWRNPSDDVVSELRFHLYFNAFKNNRSTFMRESGGQLRGDRSGSKAEYWGAIDVLSIRTAAGEDLRPGARFVQPDENDITDETVLAVPLSVPVPPRGQIAVDIVFRD